MATESKSKQLAALPRPSIYASPEKAKAPEPPKQVEKPVAGKRGRGRPKIEGERSWQAEGISRALWYRRRKESGQ